MTKLITAFILAAFFMPLLTLAEAEEKQPDYPPDLIFFKQELNSFVLNAKKIDRTRTQMDEKAYEAALHELMVIGARIADIYFRNANETFRPQMEETLGSTLAENRNLKNYWVPLGNGFVNRAQAFIEERATHENQVRFWATVGGVALGALGGGTYLYFRSAATSGIVLKEALVATTAVVGGGLLGRYAASPAINAFVFPANLSVKNAKDFMVRYPHGEDFLEEITSDDKNEIHAMEDLLEDLEIDV